MSIKNMWENAAPRTKRILMMSMAVSAFVMLATFVAFMDRSKPKPKSAKTTSETTVMMPSRKNTDMESLAAGNTSANRRVTAVENDLKAGFAGMQDQFKQLRETMQSDGAGHRDVNDLKMQVATLTKKLDELSRSPAPSSTQLPAAPGAKAPPPLKQPLEKVIPRTGETHPGEPATDGSANLKAAEPAAVEHKLRVISAKDASHDSKGGAKAAGTVPQQSGAATQKDAGDSDESYMPMGSMLQGVLINGVDASTSGAAQKNPTPVLVRIKHDAILPNRARLDIKECFVIASGYGVMSTERANLRTEGISCVRDDGGVIEAALNGYVVGEDGKVGLRGRVVTKQGAVIAQSLSAGLLSGLGKALQPTGIVGVNLNPGSSMQTQSPDFNSALDAGLLGGASNTLNQISKFYLDIAKEMVPVVEIDAMRPVTIMLTKGVSIKFKRK